MSYTEKRCDWSTADPLYLKYHDDEWGVPVHEEHLLFEKIVLEGAQAGLSWLTILKRRENYRRAFDNFDIAKVALYGETELKRLVEDKGIIRNKKKIQSAINNAQRTLDIQKKYGSLDQFLWSFVGGKTVHNSWPCMSTIPTITKESTAMSKALKNEGFTFIGPTSCYAMMQALGMVNDHLSSCFRHQELKTLAV